jgi:hypothetical protein
VFVCLDFGENYATWTAILSDHAERIYKELPTVIDCKQLNQLQLLILTKASYRDLNILLGYSRVLELTRVVSVSRPIRSSDFQLSPTTFHI